MKAPGPVKVMAVPTPQPRQWLLLVLERHGAIVAVTVCELGSIGALVESLELVLPEAA